MLLITSPWLIHFVTANAYPLISFTLLPTFHPPPLAIINLFSAMHTVLYPLSLAIISCLKMSLAFWKRSYDKPKQLIKKQRHYFANKDPSSQSCGFSSSHVWMWELDHNEGWASKNWCFWTVVLEKTLESPLDCREIKRVNPKSILNIHWKHWCWSWSSKTLATWWEEPTHWKRPWCWERLKAKGERDDRGWDGWVASLTQWTWIRASSGRWWRTREPGVLQPMGSQRVEHDLTTEQQQRCL